MVDPFLIYKGIETGLNIGSSILGNRSADRARRDQNRFNKLQAQYSYQQNMRQYGYDVSSAQNQLAFARAQAKQELAVASAIANQEWQFNNAVSRFNYIREKTNSELDWQYRTAAQKMDWQLQQTLQAAEYRASMRAFEQSEIAYARQIDLNTQAANQAYESEQFKIASVRQQVAMEADSLRTSTQQQLGRIAASGRQGQSIGRLMQDASQQYARDIGILGLNLAYANTDFKMELQDNWLAAQNANADAESRRMLRPMDMINIPQPIDLPKAFIPKPLMAPRPAINAARPITPRRIIPPAPPVKAPVALARPSGTGAMFSNIGSSILSGISTYKPAPPAINQQPRPATPGARTGFSP
jgi:hypothetical protein